MKESVFDYTQLAGWRQGDGDNSERLSRLQYQENMTVTQIAQQLRVNKSTVSRCLRRARRTLHDRLRFAL